LHKTLALQPLKRLFILIFLFVSATKLVAQDGPVQGIVFDKDSKQRLSRVYIYNLRTHKGFYNNNRGEFNNAFVANGDTLIAALQGYMVDTVKVQSNTAIFYLKRLSIFLQEVVVRDSTKNPGEKYRDNQDAYDQAYRKGNPGDLLRVGGGNGVGVGLSIDALWSLLSREGRNARYLQKILERDYHESIIDYRFTRRLNASVTGLSGDALRDFMQQYRPSYYFVLDANDYNLIAYIKDAYLRYKQNPAANRLPPLKQ